MSENKFNLDTLWQFSIDATDGCQLIIDSFKDLENIDRRIHVLALGKAAGAMSTGAVEILGERIGKVIVVAATETGAPKNAEILLGNHPYPGPASYEAGRKLMEYACSIRKSGEAAMVLVSGGGSALCEVPSPGLSEDDLTVAHRALLSSGAPIETMNRIRCRLSAIKGGGLALALGESLQWEGILVDVPSGDPDAVASGPCTLKFFPEDIGYCCSKRYKDTESKDYPGDCMEYRPGSSSFSPLSMQVDRRIIGCPRMLSDKAYNIAKNMGIPVRQRNETVSGLTVEDFGEEIIREITGEKGLWIATGEISVPLPQWRPQGNGGRAQHLALWMLREMKNRFPDKKWAFLAAGSDGRDGFGAAGASVSSDINIDIEKMDRGLDRFSSGDVHRNMGTLLKERPPRTNLTDLYLAWAK